MAFRRSIGVAFHSAELFCVGFFSAGAGGEVGSGKAAVFVSVVEPGVMSTIAVLSDDAFESLTDAARVDASVPGLIMIRGMGGITTAVASAGPATRGIASADPLGAAITTVGDGIDRISEATTSDGMTVTAVLTGNGRTAGSDAGISIGVGTSAAAATGGVDSGNSSAGSGNGICFKGFSGIGTDGVVAGTAGVTGVVSGTGDFGSTVGIGIGTGSGVVVDGTEGEGVAGFTVGVPAGVAARVPGCGIPEGVPGFTAAPGTAGGVEATSVPDAGGVKVAGAVPGVVGDGIAVTALPAGTGCELEIALVFCGC